MKPIQVVGVTAAGLFILNMLSRKAAAGTLNIYQGAVKGISWEGLTPVITVGIIVSNTSNQTFNINSLAGSMTTITNGKNYVIGSASSFTRQSILPNSQTTVWIDVKLSIIGVVADIFNIIQYGNYEQALTFNGYVNVDGLQVPVNFNYKVG